MIFGPPNVCKSRKDIMKDVAFSLVVEVKKSYLCLYWKDILKKFDVTFCFLKYGTKVAFFRCRICDGSVIKLDSIEASTSSFNLISIIIPH